MSVSYALRESMNFQSVLFGIAGAIYATSKGAQRLAACLVSWVPVLWIALQVGAKASVLVAVLVGAVACAAMYPGNCGRRVWRLVGADGE